MSTFGELIREKRLKADLSLREVAKRIGISHVLLGEVERGARAKLVEAHWPKLIESITGAGVKLTATELKQAAQNGVPVEFDLSKASPEMREFTHLLARKIEDGQLSSEKTRRLITMLEDD